MSYLLIPASLLLVPLHAVPLTQHGQRHDQPLPLGKKHRADVGCSPADLKIVIERTQKDDLCVLGLRFTGDPAAPPERFASLRKHLGDSFIGVEIDSSAGNQWGHKRAAHSVLTEDLVDQAGQPTQEALNQVLDFLDQRLAG